MRATGLIKVCYKLLLLKATPPITCTWRIARHRFRPCSTCKAARNRNRR
jgi:hypothetical protein